MKNKFVKAFYNEELPDGSEVSIPLIVSRKLGMEKITRNCQIIKN